MAGGRGGTGVYGTGGDGGEIGQDGQSKPNDQGGENAGGAAGTPPGGNGNQGTSNTARGPGAGGGGGANGTADVPGGGNGGNGNNGSEGGHSDGGGGGGAGADGLIATASFTSIASFKGGNGGNGGLGGSGNDTTAEGGGGGDGGDGILADGTGLTFTNAVGLTIAGGKGGFGGGGSNALFDSNANEGTPGGNGGDGGQGGIGIDAGDGNVVVNRGTISGGDGGLPGLGGPGKGAENGKEGAVGDGAAAIVGSNLSVTNSGTITGGMSGDNTVQADAIDFTGGTTNSLTLNTTATNGGLSGNLGLGGTVTITPDAGGTTLTSVLHDLSDTAKGTLVKAGGGTLKLSAGNTYSGGTTLNAGRLELAGATNVADSGNGIVTSGAAGTGPIAFGTGPVTLQVDDAAFTGFGNQHELFYALTNFAQGDAVNLTNIASTSASLSYQDGTLTVHDNTNNQTDQLMINQPAGTQFGLVQDAVGGGVDVVLTTPTSTGGGQPSPTPTPTPSPTPTPTPAPTPAPTPEPIPVDAVSISPTVTYANGVFTLSGTASSTAGASPVEISAVVDGVRQNLGTAVVNADGTFTFADAVTDQQTFFQARLPDGTVSADPGFNLQGGLGPRGADGRQNSFSPTEQVSSTLFRANGTRQVSVTAPGQTVALQPYDTVLGGRQGNTTFVYTPGGETGAVDVIRGFKAGGANHDVLSLPGADFGNSIANVLRNTGDVGGSAFVTDPVTGDAIRLAGVSTAELKRNDFTFHA